MRLTALILLGLENLSVENSAAGCGIYRALRACAKRGKPRDTLPKARGKPLVERCYLNGERVRVNLVATRTRGVNLRIKWNFRTSYVEGTSG